MIEEVSHRTKNTLHVAAALLSLQARVASSAEVSPALPTPRDRLQLLANDAIAIALLSNEIITNAFKHASADESAGEVTCWLHSTPALRAPCARNPPVGIELRLTSVQCAELVHAGLRSRAEVLPGFAHDVRQE